LTSQPVFLHEELHKQWDVLLPLPERRQGEGDDVEAKEQVSRPASHGELRDGYDE
jgi:hypothetical protein